MHGCATLRPHALAVRSHAYPRLHAFFSISAGKDFVHQLNMICKVIGTPTGHELAAVANDKSRAYLASMPYFPPQGEVHAWFICLLRMFWACASVANDKSRAYLASMPYFPPQGEP